MKLTDVTELQQSKEFAIATNLEAVNYGKNVGPDLVDWGREGSGAATSGTLVSGPRFLTDEQVAPTSRGARGRGGDRGRALLLGDRERPPSYHYLRPSNMNI